MWKQLKTKEDLVRLSEGDKIRVKGEDNVVNKVDSDGDVGVSELLPDDSYIIVGRGCDDDLDRWLVEAWIEPSEPAQTVRPAQPAIDHNNWKVDVRTLTDDELETVRAYLVEKCKEDSNTCPSLEQKALQDSERNDKINALEKTIQDAQDQLKELKEVC